MPRAPGSGKHFKFAFLFPRRVNVKRSCTASGTLKPPCSAEENGRPLHRGRVYPVKAPCSGAGNVNRFPPPQYTLIPSCTGSGTFKSFGPRARENCRPAPRVQKRASGKNRGQYTLRRPPGVGYI
ncbi:hypothetical protein PBY51_002265 [Eleginops maclovinus]|uniref:Uncharacterized protein n=1 Tax=Eleginops maclovinus TaxID=56733 RepID=A0AAN7XCF1_ELEMC|nr:hypothetical protein PBY51_002265 [Eleginops maclovinus]